MYKNKIKEMLKTGSEMPCWALVKGDPEAVEIAGLCGLDGVMFDVEHTSLTFRDVLDLIRAAEVVGAVPMVRVGGLDEVEILRYLDMGAMGIQVPGIRNAEDAKEAVSLIKYAPMGKRGLSQVRAADYAIKRPITEYVQMANEETMVILMVENREALENLDEILQVEGVDAVSIGTTDLSLSLGYPGQPKHPEVLAAVAKVVEACNKYGVAVGTQMRDGRTAESMRADGFTFATSSVAAWIKKGAKDFVKGVKNK